MGSAIRFFPKEPNRDWKIFPSLLELPVYSASMCLWALIKAAEKADRSRWYFWKVNVTPLSVLCFAGRERWSGVAGHGRPLAADSPAHIYEEIPWSAVETDYEDVGDDNRDNRFDSSTRYPSQTSAVHIGSAKTEVSPARLSDGRSGRFDSVQTENCVLAGQSETNRGVTDCSLQTSSSETQRNQLNKVQHGPTGRNHNKKVTPMVTSDPRVNQPGCEPYMVVDLANQPNSHSDQSVTNPASRVKVNQSKDGHGPAPVPVVDIVSSAAGHWNRPPKGTRTPGQTTQHSVPASNCRVELHPESMESEESRTEAENRTESTAVNQPQPVEDGLEKYAGNFVQCTKCNRPHGLFNGTQIKHFDEHGEICGGCGEDQSTFDRLSVRARSLGPQNGAPFCRDANSSKAFGPKVRTNPRVSERNFKFTRSPSLDSCMKNLSQSEAGNAHQAVGKENLNPGTKVQESDSADTCNEYDMQTGSENSSGKSVSSGQRSSIASDSATSNLYGSEGGSHDNLNSRQFPRTKLNESDSSNDTFSEYDIRSSDSYTSAKGMVDEYDFYLSKIRQNLWFKQDTLRVIRESESSEYETSDYQSSSMAGSVYTASSDASVLMASNTRHDVSNCSAFSGPKDVKLKGILKHHTKGAGLPSNRPKRSIVIKEDSPTRSKGSNLMNSSSHGCVQARKKPNRRRSTGTMPHSLECYTLPDFSSPSGSPVIPDSANNNSITKVTGDSLLDTSLSSDTDSSMRSDRGNDSDILDRLSCRVTNYKLEPASIVPPPGGNSPGSSMGDNSVSAFTKVAPSKPNSSTAAPPKLTNAGAAGKAMRAPAQGRPQHNRLLTDLMKINHDRQLLFL